MPDVNGIDWDLVVKAVGAIVGVFVSLYQLRNIKPRLRSTLKTDVELLKNLEPGGLSHQTVKEHIDYMIQRLYQSDREKTGSRFKIYSWSDFTLGIIFLPGFLVWSIYLFRDGFNWWGLVTAFFAFAGFGGIVNSLDKPSQPIVKTEKNIPTVAGTD